MRRPNADSTPNPEIATRAYGTLERPIFFQATGRLSPESACARRPLLGREMRAALREGDEGNGAPLPEAGLSPFGSSCLGGAAEV